LWLLVVRVLRLVARVRVGFPAGLSGLAGGWLFGFRDGCLAVFGWLDIGCWLGPVRVDG
jgi:hypothetical protein